MALAVAVTVEVALAGGRLQADRMKDNRTKILIVFFITALLF